MKWSRKILIGLLVFLVLLFMVNLGVNYWITHKLPMVINRENDSPYHITYEDLDVSLLSRSILATNIILVPKSSMEDTITKAGIYANIESVEVRNFKIMDLIFTDKITAKSIHINKPGIILYQLNEKAINDVKSLRNKVVEPFRKVILVSDIYINEGDLKILYVKTNEPILHVNNISVALDGIVITDDILEQKIPFGFSNYEAS